MDRPIKRLKTTKADARSPRETGSKMAEGLFTSEMGSTSDSDESSGPRPTRTIELSDLRRRYKMKPQRRQTLPRGNVGLELYPRAPDTTVTATVVDVNVDEGTTTVAATEVTIATDATATVLSLSSYEGSITVPGISTTTSDSSITSSDSTTSSNAITSSTTLAPAASILSAALTGNGTITSSSSIESTVTVTATSTFEISYINGTFLPDSTKTDHRTVTTHKSGTGKSSITSTLSLTDSSSGSNTQSSTSVSSDASGVLTASSSDSAQSTYVPGSSPTSSPPSLTTSLSSAASSTAPASNNKNSGSSLSPAQQQTVGGVIGGVAGIALILFVLLVILRWYRRRLKAQGALPEQRHQRDLTSAGDGTEMTSNRSSNVPLAAAMARLGRWRPQSSATVATTATGSTATATAEEKGFQRIAGRKIAPVLATGGDGFGGTYGAFEKEAGSPTSAASGLLSGSRGAGPMDRQGLERDLARSSFYRDKSGFYGGTGEQRSSSMPGSQRQPIGLHNRGPSVTRDFADEPGPSTGADLKSRSEMDLATARTMNRPEGFAVMRPSPARTPTTGSVNAAEVRMSMPQGGEGQLGTFFVPDSAPPTPPLPDGARGRLLVPSLRGSPAVSRSSGGSRFREVV